MVICYGYKILLSGEIDRVDREELGLLVMLLDKGEGMSYI